MLFRRNGERFGLCRCPRGVGRLVQERPGFDRRHGRKAPRRNRPLRPGGHRALDDLSGVDGDRRGRRRLGRDRRGGVDRWGRHRHLITLDEKIRGGVRTRCGASQGIGEG